MKKLVTVALAATLSLSFTSALAQNPGEAGIFADPAGTTSTLQITAFVPTFFYAVGFELGDVLGYEFGTSGLSGLTVLSAVYLAGPNGGINLGDTTGEYIVGTGACLPGAGAVRMVTFNVGNFTDPTNATMTDKAVCITGSTPSSFPADGNAPGWLRCDGRLEAFGVAQNGQGAYPNGCLIFNPTQEGPVATDSASFGEMKARF